MAKKAAPAQTLGDFLQNPRPQHQDYSKTNLCCREEDLLYPEGMTRSVQVGLALIVVAVNSLAYALVWRRRRTNC